MAREIEEIYKSLAIGIIANINSKWDKAHLYTEFFEDAAEFKGEYTLDNKTNFFEVSDQAFDDFDELYQITTEDSDNKWNRAIYSLEPTGKFNIEFEWDQELADEIERLNNED